MVDTILTTHWGKGESVALADVEKLFSWEAVEAAILARKPAPEGYEVPGDRAKGIAAAIEAASDRGDWADVAELCKELDATVTGDTVINDATRKGVLGDPYGNGYSILGVHGPDRPTDQYRDSLLRNTEQILGDSLVIMSAGLLYGGAVGFVQVTVPDTIKTQSGVEFSPFLTATTSHSGLYALRYDAGSGNIVCRNTHAAFLKDAVATSKLKHTKNADFTITSTHEALDIMHTVTKDFAAEVDRLNEVVVTPDTLDAFINSIAPVKDEPRSAGKAEKRREALYELWTTDERVAPWGGKWDSGTGTAWGIVQMMNTEAHHLSRVNSGYDRDTRIMERTIKGDFYKLDKDTLGRLEKVMATA